LILSVEPEMTDHLKMIWPYVVNGWRPALEILILAVLIYYAFRFLRGTRGWPVVIGLVVTLVVLFAVSALLKVLKLQVLSWLLSGAAPDAGGAGHPAVVRQRS
jgi:DNA integrity scanning protein DisA with diadenylate cyclase activity